MKRICGIDPGLASGGIVLLQTSPKRVLQTCSLVEARGSVSRSRSQAEELLLGGWGDRQFTAASLRAESWIGGARSALEEMVKSHGEIDFFAVESFVDQPSRARAEKAGLMRNRWQTPFLMGRLEDLLLARGASVGNGRIVYQNAGVVIPQMRREIALLEKGESIVPGDDSVSNDHLRKALAHALALEIRISRLAKKDPALTRTGVESEEGPDE